MKTKSIYLAALSLLVLVTIAYMTQRRFDEDPVVVLRKITPKPTNPIVAEPAKLVSFELLNNGRYTLTCQDSWSLEFEDGRVQVLQLSASGLMWVKPGQKGKIAITNPATTGAWRLVANYYFEDISFEVKAKIDQSALKNTLPQSASTVRGQNVMSEWIK